MATDSPCRETLGVNFFDLPESGSKQVWSDKHISVKAVSFQPEQQPEHDEHDGNFDWQRSGWKIAELGTRQLSWWRRQVISGMFSKVAAPIVDSKATDSIDEHDAVPGVGAPASWSQNAARMHLGQMIPYPHASKRRCSYILQAPKVRGKFDASKARALGVPKGPSNGILASGKSLEIDDPEAPGGKRTILPEQVLEPEKEGGVSVDPQSWLRVKSLTESRSSRASLSMPMSRCSSHFCDQTILTSIGSRARNSPQMSLCTVSLSRSHMTIGIELGCGGLEAIHK